MSFAKNQDEEVTSVPGVRYTDAEGDTGSRSSSIGNDAAGGCGRRGQAPSRSPQLKDVEMSSLRGTRSRVGEDYSDASWAEQGESASLV